MQQTNFRTYELAVSLYRDCAQLRVKSHVRDQLERASLSVVLNLSEGAAKPSANDKKRFYGYAYGSIREVQSILRVIDNGVLFKRADELGACAFKLIKATH